MSATPGSPTKPLYDPIAPPERDPPNKPMHDPPGDPTFEPPQPLTEPTPNPASDPPPEMPGDPPQMLGGRRGLPGASTHTGGYATWASPICFSVEYRTSPQGSAGVDAALTLDEVVQRRGIRLVHRRVPHDPRPLASRPFVVAGVRGAGASEFIHLPPAPSNHEGAMLLRRAGVHVAAPI